MLMRIFFVKKLKNNLEMKLPFRTALLASVLCVQLNAQDGMDDFFEEESTEKTPVIATFKSTHLINAPTNETVKKGTLDFRITHRFGDVATNGAGHTLLGLDNASNIRFSFDFGITDKLMIGVGRSKTNEHIDGNLKYRFIDQKKGGFPFNIALYANVALTPRRAISETDLPKFTSRLSYAYQGIITSKLNWRASIGILPTFVHRNFVGNVPNPNNGSFDENSLFAIGAMGRFKITQSIALIGEYFYTFSDYRKDNTAVPYYMPLGIGVEIETGGHVFQMNYTNTSGIIANDYVPNSASNWLDGEFKIGFTISRVFNL